LRLDRFELRLKIEMQENNHNLGYMHIEYLYQIILCIRFWFYKKRESFHTIIDKSNTFTFYYYDIIFGRLFYRDTIVF